MSRLRAGLLTSSVVTATALTASALAFVAAPAAQAAGCGTVESVTVDGGAVPAGFDVDASCDSGGGSRTVRWSVDDGGDPDLGASARSQTWAIRIDTGTIVPRVTATHGAAVSVTRSRTGDGHWHVDITAKPVLLLGECNQGAWPWTCDHVATQQWDGYLDGEVTDYGSWEDAAQREAFYGMDLSSDISATSVPPQIVKDPDSGAEMILLELANPHFLKSDPTQVFRGSVKVRIPNAFLKEVYAVDSPSTLTSAGLSPDISGSAPGTVTVTDDGSALVVKGEGITFSARKIRVERGVIVPGKPTSVAAKRTGATTAKLTFTAAKARGSKVTGHKARCVARTGTHVVVDRESNASPQYVSGLRRGVAYDCTVRGTSKAGPGSVSASVRVPKTA